MTVNLTPTAMDQIDKLCVENQGKWVRLAILSGGCNGFNKVFDLVDTIESDDLIISCHSGKLLIDSMSLEFLKDSVIDYKMDLIGSYFAVDIPEATSSCGCGSSFSI